MIFRGGSILQVGALHLYTNNLNVGVLTFYYIAKVDHDVFFLNHERWARAPPCLSVL